MQTNFAPPPARTQSYTKFSTPLVLEPPLHCGLPTIRLGLGKHLLGTDSSCTVRVRADNVEPRHAMIVVSEHRTVVKALHPQTWVNEGPVSETALRPGDRLSLGPLTFRVRAARVDELAGFQEANAGTFQAEDSFPSDDLMNRNGAVDTAWRIDSTSKPAHDSSPAVRAVTSAFSPPTTSRDSAPAIPTITALVKHFEASALPEHSAAARDRGPVAKTKSWAEITVPVAVARVTPELPAVASELVPVAVLNEASFAENASANRAQGRSTSDNATPSSNATSSSSVSSAPALDQRLEEISRKLAELDRPIRERSVSHERATVSDETAERVESLAAERRHVSEQQAELQLRAAELARQTEQLQRQAARVAEREVEANRVQAELAREHEGLRLTTESTRRELDDEYARHQTLWQEWDSAYRRTSGELNEQLQSLEQRRASITTDSERLVLERSHVQRLLAEQERDRREIAVLQSQLTNDHASLKSLRTEFGIERQQHLDAIQERETQLATERRSAVALQAELLSARQQFERDRTVFLTERSATATQLDRERFGLIERRERLEHETTRLHDDRWELDRLRQVTEAERTEFAAERETLRSQLAELTTQVTADRTELAHVREQLSQVQAELLQVQSEPSHTTTPFVAAPFSAGSSGANPVEVARRERFVDPYANVDLPPLIVGSPFKYLAQAFGLSREPTVPVTPAMAHTSPRETIPTGTVASERFVDPYADVQWPSLNEDFADPTVTDRVENLQSRTKTNVCIEQPLPLAPTETSVVSELFAAEASLSPSSFDSEVDLDHEVAEVESLPIILSSPDWELPSDEPDLVEQSLAAEPVFVDQSADELQPVDMLANDTSCEDVDGDSVANAEPVPEVTQEQGDNDEESESVFSLPRTNPTSATNSPGSDASSTGTEATGYRFWEDSTLYVISRGLSAGETPMFIDSPNERMSSSKFASPAAIPAKIAASLTVDQPVPNDECADEHSSGDSVEIWCRSFDATGEEIVGEVEVAAEVESSAETALATLEAPASIDETLAEVNREFGVHLTATDGFAFAPTLEEAAELQPVDHESGRPESEVFDFSQFDSSIFYVPPASPVPADEHCIEQDAAPEVVSAVASSVDYNSLEAVLARLQSMMAPEAASDLQDSALNEQEELAARLASEQSDVLAAAEDADEESSEWDAESSELTAVDLPAFELMSVEIAVADFSKEVAALEQPASNASLTEETQLTESAREEFHVPEVDDVEAESTTDLQVGSATGLSQLPAWWKECESIKIPVYEGPHCEDDVSDLVAAGLIAPDEEVAEHEPQQTSEPETAAANDPLASLRAQLAQMFDMKTEAPANSDSELTEAASSLEEEARHETDPESVETSGELAESLIETPGSTSEASAPADAAREHQHPSEAAATTAPVQVETSAGRHEEDDSVESYMARLLSRARGGAVVSPKEVKALATPVPSPIAGSAASSDAEEVPFDPADRSHLKAEPKHKQDRQAARDDLQSFRQLAHQSARSALARHTTKTLLGTLIAKSMLLSVSAAATVFYLGAPLVGWPSEIWNGLACALATVLSGIEFHRSWSKLRKSRQHGQKPTKRDASGVAAPTSAVAATE